MKSEIFSTELKTIKDPIVRDLCERALENTDEKFYSAPASSTGKYHPLYSLGDGGLVRHVKGALYFCNSLLEIEQYKQLFSDIECDCIRCAIILHDTCKSGIKWVGKYTVHEHPILVVDLIEHDDDDLSNEELHLWGIITDLIGCHMGEWNINNKSDIVLKKPETEAEKFVHLCDYLSSRKPVQLLIFDESETSNIPEERKVEDWMLQPATDKQVKFIKTLLDSAIEMESIAEEYITEVLDKINNNKLTKSNSSDIINVLKASLSTKK